MISRRFIHRRRFVPRSAVCLALLVLGFALQVSTARACFGPKLYIGLGDAAEQRAFYAVVALYIKEKTGVETVAVPLEGADPLHFLREKRVDMAFAPDLAEEFTPLVTAAGVPYLLSGRRPLEELQFTTVAPALQRLDRLLTPELFQALAAEVAAGAPPAAAARAFLMRQRWI
ncbi:hypothetical protein [Geoalkalibacter sp.]|uniref:hypothetical protein n=1 Tax=Geoalkalibacter sp. TaxID=3041440 RepID=UPI00272E7AC1|nr:hypothetical protein [Geoalkalibacter sp.]